MSFIDELKIHIRAGDGGGGVVRWLHEKGKEYGGPSGGDGGNGGSVFAVAVRDLAKLSEYKREKEFRAARGEDGRNKNQHGATAPDFEIPFPVGCIITNLKTKKTIELFHDGEKVLLLKGGRGGFGNRHYKSSRNVNPMQSKPGAPGEEADFYIELQLIADAGFIGLPNAGKTSLLNELTNAGAKVGSYEFTTLEPNLGALYGFILADIPGLIEGASTGKGLGIKFLRHVRRTKVLLHCISLESKKLAGDYKTVRDELKRYDKALCGKEEVIILTKTDAVSPAEVKRAAAKMKKKADKVFAVSILDDESIGNLKENLIKILK